MTIAKPDILTQVDLILVADNDELSAEARYSFVEAAVEQYSHDLPDEVTADVTGDGGNYYAIATALTSWSEGFSQILSIEYPAATVASDEAPTYLEPDDWDDNYWAGGVRYLYLPNHAPPATEKMRITYTAPYSTTNNAYDFPPAHFHAVCYLAASLCARAISNKYSRTNDSSIAADSVNHMSRADEWNRRAGALFRLYREQLKLSGRSGRPAGEFVDWDTQPSESRRWLYH